MTDTVQQSVLVLEKGSKSFHFASHFLPEANRNDAAVLYAFCRLVDDLADERESDEEALENLHDVEEELYGRRTPRPLMAEFLAMAERRNIEPSHARELIAGVTSDIKTVRIPDDRALIRYCYRVAGTVGLMMCGVLGVEDPTAWRHAIDLGIAMQLTNICRDVAEDARLGRTYLPATRLTESKTSPIALIDGSASRYAIRGIVKDLLMWAERYYQSARAGMHFIPLRPRAAILVASRVYREIGVQLLESGADALAGRTVVSKPRKMWVSTRALAHLARPSLWGLGAAEHEPELHIPIADLPGAHRPEGIRLLAAEGI